MPQTERNYVTRFCTDRKVHNSLDHHILNHDEKVMKSIKIIHRKSGMFSKVISQSKNVRRRSDEIDDDGFCFLRTYQASFDSLEDAGSERRLPPRRRCERTSRRPGRSLSHSWRRFYLPEKQ